MISIAKAWRLESALRRGKIDRVWSTIACNVRSCVCLGDVSSRTPYDKPKLDCLRVRGCSKQGSFRFTFMVNVDTSWNFNLTAVGEITGCWF